VADAVSRHARERPTAKAVACDGRALTYEQLDSRANQIARELGERGLGKGDLAGVVLQRSLELLPALLGVLRAGGAYVPIDPAYPAARIGFILERAATKVIVSQASVAGGLPRPGAPLLLLDDDREAIERQDPGAVETGADLDDLAYVIFTSGSTGRPKGVMLAHRGLAHLMRTMAERPGLAAGEAMLGVTTPAFDLSVPDLYLPLSVGATLVLASAEQAGDGRELIRLIEDHEIDLMQATPSTWRMLIESGWSGRSRLRVVSGGEALPVRLAQGLLDRVGELWNFYGPTEATVWSTCARITAAEGITIGSELPGMSAHIVDELGNAAPDGSAGELLIGGPQVARGYLGQAELTAERFIPDPASAAPGAHLYRTGDRARRGADGAIEFLGRLDNQVKLRGYRIELGEIESVLEESAAVAQAVAVVREPRDGAEPQLVAYAVAAAGTSIDGRELRHSLRERLPDYMVPACVLVLERLPLTPNGKIDRAALPQPEPVEAGEGVAPRSALEAELLELWCDALGIASLGVTDDFFDLGVDSLTAGRLFARIEREYGRHLPRAVLFQAPTVERLASLLGDGAETAPRWPSLVPMRTGGERTPLFCVHGGAGTVLFYRELVEALGEDQPVYALQAAGLYGDEPPQRSVEAMAAAYLEQLREASPQGPYLIGGYCYGGMVAFEIARRLRAEGAEVEAVVMFNAPSAGYNRRYHPYFDEQGAMVDGEGRLRADLVPRDGSIGASLRRHLGDESASSRARALAAAAARRVRVNARARARRVRFAAYLRLGRPLPDDLREATAFQLIAARAQRSYEPATLDSRIVVFRSPGLYYEDDLGWGPHTTRGVESFEAPGEHRTPRDLMSEPSVSYVAERLRASVDERLDLAEGRA
jgi:amino acid adenylation domain-containing protein